MLTPKQCATRLSEGDQILLLCHKNPDGDTVGCAFALFYALTAMGKQARVACADPLPKKYAFLYPDYMPEVDPKMVVAVDVASQAQLGSLAEDYADRIDLCIDHHGTNTHYAKEDLVVASAAAATEIVAEILNEMGEVWTPQIAECIYTGLSSDTGCFRYTNTTINTYHCAANMIEKGADSGKINLILFETKSRSRVALESRVLSQLQYEFDGMVAFAVISQEILKETGATEEEIDGIASLPRTIEGVQIAVTLRERDPRQYRVSIRTKGRFDAAMMCRQFGGGGHSAAAGCTIDDTLENALDRLRAVIAACLEGER